MCMTLNPARLSNTCILVGKSPKTGKHYTWYRNSVASTVPDRQSATRSRSPGSGLDVLHTPDSGSRSSGSGLDVLRTTDSRSARPASWTETVVPADNGQVYDNMMFWPVFGVFDSIEAIDTKTAPNAMSDVQRAIQQGNQDNELLSFSTTRGGAAPKSVRIVETKFYTHVIAEDPADIPNALKQAGITLPGTDDAAFACVVADMGSFYPGIPFVLNLFKAGAPADGAILIAYEPLPDWSDIFFVPMLDGHGELDVNENVSVDHTIAVAVTAAAGGIEVGYMDRYSKSRVAPEVEPYLPSHVLGVNVHSQVANGDVIFFAKDVVSGKFRGQRVLPFGIADDAAPLATLTESGFAAARK